MSDAQGEAIYRAEHCDSPLLLRGEEDLDAMIDDLLTGPVAENLAQVYSLARPLLRSGVPDHELLVGAERELGVGMLAFMDEDGNWVSKGPSDARVEPEYSIIGHAREFPARCEIPIGLVRRAVKEFMASGGKRPTCVQWMAD